MAANDYLLSDIITKCVRHLVSQCNIDGTWGDVRTTAVAAWALSELIKVIHLPESSHNEIRDLLKDSYAWIDAEGYNEGGGFCWGSEAWDTSVSIMALSYDSQYQRQVNDSISWLTTVRGVNRRVWYDEVWETTLATIAILHAKSHSAGRGIHVSDWLSPVLSWICDIPSKDTGEFVCPHYSGFLAWIAGRIAMEKNRAPIVFQPQDIAGIFTQKAEDAANWLLKRIDEQDTDLWTNDTFSNAYIISGLTSFFGNSWMISPRIDKVTNWLHRIQNDSGGGYEDVEDASLVLLALLDIVKKYSAGSSIKTSVHDACANNAIKRIPPKVFLGYSDKAKELVATTTNFLKRTFPKFDIIDWAWDFRAGRYLFEEIKNAQETCMLAIIFFTKDDLRFDVGNGEYRETPRNNVIFEAGFFMGKLGKGRTILINETGTSPFADIEGILDLRLHDGEKIDTIFCKLENRITDALKPHSNDRYRG